MSATGQIFINTEQLEQIIPHIKDVSAWCEALNKILPDYAIDSQDRIAGFLSQCAHESGGFNRLSENLNYSEKGLLTTFGKYFTAAQAKSYARQPERIANHVYANRMGNGDEASGDGWRFRGGGLIQLTGRANYQTFATAAEIQLSDAADYVRTKQGAVESAAWFWRTNGLNRYADTRDVVKMTKKINGGTNGLQDRIAYYERALKVLGG